MKLRKERDKGKSRKLPPQCGGDGKRYRNVISCTKGGEK
jgi:hypothetical protein